VGLNLLTWTRGRPGALDGRLSVLIPARDEVAQIEGCVRAALQGGLPVHELIVCDDGSTDGTTELLARLQGELPQLRVISGAPLPPGWVGKVHAMHQLAAAAEGELLLFLDADVRVAEGGLQRLAGLLPGADVVTAVPRQVMVTPAEGLLMPLLHLSYVAWLPMFLIPLVSDPRVLAANGQVLLVRRARLDQIGGVAAIKGEVVDDMALCRAVKKTGGRVIFADGRDIASCRMYQSRAEVERGFSKNLYEGIGGNLPALFVVIALHLLFFVLPYLGLLLSPFVPGLLLPALVGVALNLGLRLGMAARWGHPVWSAFAHPVGILGLLRIAVRSAVWSRSGRIEWRGRTYAGRAGRGP
jgi:glycosyltransferase involved in cell wall biosynthesis